MSEITPTESHIEAARKHLGYLPNSDVKRLLARTKRQSGKGSSFAQRDTAAAIIAMERELAWRQA